MERIESNLIQKSSNKANIIRLKRISSINRRQLNSLSSISKQTNQFIKQQSSLEKISELESISTFAGKRYYIENINKQLDSEISKIVLEKKEQIKQSLLNKPKKQITNNQSEVQQNQKIEYIKNHPLLYNKEQNNELKLDQNQLQIRINDVKRNIEYDETEYRHIRSYQGSKQTNELESQRIQQQLKKYNIYPIDLEYEGFVQQIKSLKLTQDKNNSFSNGQSKSLLKPNLQARIQIFNYQNSQYQNKITKESQRCKTEPNQYTKDQFSFSYQKKRRNESINDLKKEKLTNSRVENKNQENNEISSIIKLQDIFNNIKKLKTDQDARQADQFTKSSILKTTLNLQMDEIINNFAQQKKLSQNQIQNSSRSANKQKSIQQKIESFRELSVENFNKMKYQLKVKKIADKPYYQKMDKFTLQKELQKMGLTLESYLNISQNNSKLQN